MDSATAVSYRDGVHEAGSWQYGGNAAGISRRALGDDNVKPSGTAVCRTAANQQRWGLACFYTSIWANHAASYINHALASSILPQSRLAMRCAKRPMFQIAFDFILFHFISFRCNRGWKGCDYICIS